MILKLKRTPGIFLVGFMGCGKSVVGGKLAERLGWAFADIDSDIERERNTTINDIFDTLGEEEFRKIESDAIRKRVHVIQSGHPIVVALGGGAFGQPQNWEVVENNGVSIWLDCPLSLIHQRLDGCTHRPLARDKISLTCSTMPAGRPTPAPITTSRSPATMRTSSSRRFSRYHSSEEFNPMSERQLRVQARAIFRAALEASDPAEAVLRNVRVSGGRLTAGKHTYRLNSFRKIFVIGAGKASAAMAQAIERLLGRGIHSGLVNVKYGHRARLRRVELNECGHPVPDEAGVRGAQRIAAIAEGAGPEDLVICLMSGGGSALMPSPAPPVTLEEKQAVTRLLLASGANIHEINASANTFRSSRAASWPGWRPQPPFFRSCSATSSATTST